MIDLKELKSNKLKLSIIIAIIVALLAIILFLIFSKNDNGNGEHTGQDISEFATFQDSQQKLSFKYPSAAKIESGDEDACISVDGDCQFYSMHLSSSLIKTGIDKFDNDLYEIQVMAKQQTWQDFQQNYCPVDEVRADIIEYGEVNPDRPLCIEEYEATTRSNVYSPDTTRQPTNNDSATENENGVKLYQFESRYGSDSPFNVAVVAQSGDLIYEVIIYRHSSSDHSGDQGAELMTEIVKSIEVKD